MLQPVDYLLFQICFYSIYAKSFVCGEIFYMEKYDKNNFRDPKCDKKYNQQCILYRSALGWYPN